MKKLPLVLTLLLLQFHIAAQQAPKTAKKSAETATDIALDFPKPYPVEDMKKYNGIEIETMYLSMRDGVKLAIDIYLPKGLKKGDQLPCLVRQTRYWRSPKINFPFSLFTDGLLGRSGELIKTVVEHGYVVVNVDARGSGASYGSRKHPWTKEEVQDGYEILDWISAQDWSNKKIGSLGFSYGGTAAEFLATTKHPNLKAVALLFSLFDVYEDNAFPGGIHNVWFTNGLDKEPKVHYFTLAEDKWKNASNWPPESSPERLYFSANHRLGEEPNADAQSFEIASTDFASGEQTRWKSVNGKVTTAHVYFDWHQRASDLSYFDSTPLEEDLEISGHAQIKLQLRSNEEDAAVFVYLQEVAPDGTATYITEGQLRLSHRKISDDCPYQEVGPCISHKRADASSAKGLNELSFDLLPCSYLLKKGNKIRVSFAVQDASHFEQVGSDALQLELVHTAEEASFIDLPIVPRR